MGTAGAIFIACLDYGAAPVVIVVGPYQVEAHAVVFAGTMAGQIGG